MSYFQLRDARRYPSSSIVLISLRGEQPVFPRLEAKTGRAHLYASCPLSEGNRKAFLP